ncbi:MAG TPA: UdgX family uracil-DNA binding protein [Pyrinomonadaceae bacterium]|nr:UdgX family uracil-DNA binding protein [Pyrinomonadaceae bacterium]
MNAKQTAGKRSALDYFPAKIDLPALQHAAATCKGCDIYKLGGPTVFGEGPATAELMLVGEVPGDEEDRLGHPFVGPAGRLLNEALEEVGIDREQVYVTNVVKHFKWKPSPRGGKRRLHERPKASEIIACSPWLAAEIEVVRPRILVCLGATAAQALLGKDFRVTKMRGQWVASVLAEKVMATIHPSAILRTPDSDQREIQYRSFVADLMVVAAELKKRKSAHAK